MNRPSFLLLPLLFLLACQPRPVPDSAPPAAQEAVEGAFSQEASAAAAEHFNEAQAALLEEAAESGEELAGEPEEDPANSDDPRVRLGIAGRPGPRNVILMVGDGFGPVHEDIGSRWIHGEPDRLFIQGAPHRSRVTTYCANAEITDSSSAASAMSTGEKIAYEAVAVRFPDNTEPLETIAEQFVASGRVAGLVTSTRLTDATPASFAAHVAYRWDQEEISRQMLQSGLQLFFAGGGKGYTAPNARAAGYQVATNLAEMQAFDSSASSWAYVVGGGHRPYIHDGSGDIPPLRDMGLKAIELLSSHPQGFFLLIEGGRIDHAAHNNHIQRLLPEIRDYDEAVQAVVAWALERDDTLVLSTADHETGGLALVEPAPAGVVPQVTWSTTGHTGVDVSLYGWGPFGAAVERARDNTDIYWLMQWALSGEN